MTFYLISGLLLFVRKVHIIGFNVIARNEAIKKIIVKLYEFNNTKNFYKKLHLLIEVVQGKCIKRKSMR